MKVAFIKCCDSFIDYKKRLAKSRHRPIECVVERSVKLKYEDFIFLINHLQDKNNPYVQNHLGEMFVDENGIWHVMMICCLSADKILYLMQEQDANSRYVGFVINNGEQVEFHSEHKCRKKVVFIDGEKCANFAPKNSYDNDVF